MSELSTFRIYRGFIKPGPWIPPSLLGEDKGHPPTRAKFGTLPCKGTKRLRRAVYDLKYHVVWVLKYRRMVLKGRLAKRLQEIVQGIAEFGSVQRQRG